jgi:hypothetical protein
MSTYHSIFALWLLLAKNSTIFDSTNIINPADMEYAKVTATPIRRNNIPKKNENLFPILRLTLISRFDKVVPAFCSVFDFYFLISNF